MSEVQNKWSTLKLNDDIWAKLIYFEHNRRLAKAYVSAPVLTVDGSGHGLDGFRIGLSGIENSYRSLESMASLSSIGLGVKLKIDSQGNILIRKLAAKGKQLADSGAAVYIKDWPSALGSRLLEHQQPGSQKQYELFASNWRELKQTDVSYKLFDMRHFRRQLARLSEGASSGGQQVDWRQCVSVISFVRQRSQGNRLLLEDPCWLMLINIIAIDMIKSTLDAAREPAAGRKLSAPTSLVPEGRHPERPPSSQKQAPANIGYRLKRMRVQRRYHSIQQLASNEMSHPRDLQLANPAPNSIYTTFNGKLAHSSRRPDRSSRRVAPPSGSLANESSSIGHHYGSSGTNLRRRLDHKLGSQSTDKQEQHQGYGSHSLLFPLNERLEGSGRQLDERNSALPSNRSLSLSNCDLSEQPNGNRWSQRLELRAMRSAIRMNFDTCLSEDENQADHDVDPTPMGANLRRQSQPESPEGASLLRIYKDEHVSYRSSAELASPDLDPVNHHECSANECRQITAQSEESPAPSDNAAQRQPVDQSEEAAGETIGKSNEAASSAVSSSSSGCGADHDYFMSQSSSSMSSSTASNERELFSQPTSSSGIAHSAGSTSDEGCHEDSKSPAGSKLKEETNGEKSAGDLEEKQETSAVRSQPARRPTRASATKKSIGPLACNSQVACCCKLATAPTCERPASHGIRQDYSSCHCCCECFSTLEQISCDCAAIGAPLCSGLRANPLLTARTFGGSQANLQQTTLPAANKPRMRRPSASKTLAKLEREFNGISNNPIADCSPLELRHGATNEPSTATESFAPKSSGKIEAKENQPVAKSNWLAGKHYSKMLPKFMLPSNYNKLKQTDSSQRPKNSHSNSKNLDGDQTQRSKATTRAKLSRSALDLS